MALALTEEDIATKRGIPPAQIALAWLFGQPAVTSPVVGATKASHITDAVTALEVPLSQEERALLEAPYLPHGPNASYK